MKFFFYTLVFVTIISSCSILGLTSDYKELTKTERERVVKSFGDIDSLKADKSIYLVEVQQVKNYCKKHSQVVIYNYNPYCRSSSCMQVNDFVDMCKVNGVNPLVIGNTFLGITQQRKLGIPLLMIDPQPLGTKWRAQYISLFYNKLINSNALTPPNGLYLSFQNGNYIGSYNSCKEALESLHIKDIKNY